MWSKQVCCCLFISSSVRPSVHPSVCLSAWSFLLERDCVSSIVVVSVFLNNLQHTHLFVGHFAVFFRKKEHNNLYQDISINLVKKQNGLSNNYRNCNEMESKSQRIKLQSLLIYSFAVFIIIL